MVISTTHQVVVVYYRIVTALVLKFAGVCWGATALFTSYLSVVEKSAFADILSEAA